MIKNKINKNIEYKNSSEIQKEICLKLIDIRNYSQSALYCLNNNDLKIKLACNILMDNNREVEVVMNKLNSDSLNVFNEFPISIFINKRL